MLLADKGKIGYIDEVMSVYRKNLGVLSGGIGKDVGFVSGQKIKLLNYFNVYSKGVHKRHINNKITQLEQGVRKSNVRKIFPLLYFSTTPSKILCLIIRKLKRC